MAMCEDGGGGFGYSSVKVTLSDADMRVITFPVNEYLTHITRLVDALHTLSDQRDAEIAEFLSDEGLLAHLNTPDLRYRLESITENVFFDDVIHEYEEKKKFLFFFTKTVKKQKEYGRFLKDKIDRENPNLDWFECRDIYLKIVSARLDQLIAETGSLVNAAYVLHKARHLHRSSYETPTFEQLVKWFAPSSFNANTRNEYTEDFKYYKNLAERGLWQEKQSVTIPLAEFQQHSRIIEAAKNSK